MELKQWFSYWSRSITKRGLWLAMVSLGMMSAGVRADILLTVDATNPTAVNFSATGGLSALSSSGSGYGVLLHGAIDVDGPISESYTPQPSSLRPFVGGSAFNNYGDQGDSLRLTAGGGTTQVFTAGTIAFTGTTIVDLSFVDFTSMSLVGDIEIRNNFGVPTGEIIGQYQFIPPIPEPAALGALSFAILALGRRAWARRVH